ncbi:MAG: putative magnesiumtranslocating P-type ATPase [Bacteriovoracaceae bacterium]|nr:putative magnesiumtranslocating P-type ATPase [Bacteriovoracaceae bacterium]
MFSQNPKRQDQSLFNALWNLRRPRVRNVEYRYSEFYRSAAQENSDGILQSLGTRIEGLTMDEIEARLAQFGTNEIVREKQVNWHSQLLATFKNPLVILLIILAAISFITDDIPGGVLMSAMVMLGVFLTFFQEFRSTRAAEKLRAMVTTTATVFRQLVPKSIDTDEGESPVSRPISTLKIEVPIAELVPGDIIQLSAGDIIPADVRLISSKDLFVSQSALTGEALPVEKNFQKEEQNTRSALEQRNLAFMGSSVVSGTALSTVMKTGSDTYFGSLAKSVIGQRVLTSFDKGINRFTWLMLRFMMILVPLVFLINGFAKGNWLEAFMFAIAVAVGLTPEMLPMIVTVNLARGALAMSRKKVVVKRLNSIQNFGAMDILCTDKTGTLTQDKVILEKYVDPHGNDSDEVLKYAFLNSFYQTGLKNLLDRAVLEHVEVKGSLKIETDYRKIDEIPFDFSRRRMSVVVEEQRQRHVLICKGALEEILNVTDRMETEGKITSLNDEIRRTIQKVGNDLNEDGLRVIAVAYKEMPNDQAEYTIREESELILLGFIAFLDPPKETAAQAIKALRASGVVVKVLTGDNEIVTRKICKEVGLDIDRILLGQEIEKMTDDELSDLTESIFVFAKLTPAQKQRIILAMHQKNHVVGFLGDGINDSPALRAADVGISVDNAVDIAKESADIILLEKNLLVLVDGVLEGRKVFGNITKYIKMSASSNFGNVFSIVGSSLIFPFLPMLPVQLLTQNLLYDLSQTTIPWDQVDEEYLLQPRRWEIGEIGRFMLFIGPISSIFDYATFALMWFWFGANTPAHQSLFQSGWFVEGLLSQTLIVHMIRTRKIPFIQSRASNPLIFTTIAVMALGLYIPFSALAGKIGLVPLPPSYFIFLIVILFAYALLTQKVKTWFIARYGYN